MLAGTASDAATVSMSFAAAPAGDFLSDVLTLQGTAGDAIVLSLSYDAGALGDLLPGDLFLGWLDTRAERATAGERVNSVLGNSANLVALEAPYPGSWTAYAAARRVVSRSVHIYTHCRPPQAAAIALPPGCCAQEASAHGCTHGRAFNLRAISGLAR